MSKQTKGYDMANFAHVTPETITKAQRVIDDQKLRRYSVSAIYKAHNEIFKLREPMQTCDSCLVTRANNVKKFMDWYEAQTGTPAAPQAPQAPIPTAYALEDGTTIIVDVAGLARLANADRTASTEPIAPGDYKLTDGQTLTIGEGSIAITVAIKDDAQQMDPADAASLAAGAANEQAAAPVKVLLQKVNKADYSKTEGDPFYGLFTASADNAAKGTIVREDGAAFAAGTYATEDTTKVLGVQPGGKATYKAIA